MQVSLKIVKRNEMNLCRAIMFKRIDEIYRKKFELVRVYVNIIK